MRNANSVPFDNRTTAAPACCLKDILSLSLSVLCSHLGGWILLNLARLFSLLLGIHFFILSLPLPFNRLKRRQSLTDHWQAHMPTIGHSSISTNKFRIQIFKFVAVATAGVVSKSFSEIFYEMMYPLLDENVNISLLHEVVCRQAVIRKTVTILYYDCQFVDLYRNQNATEPNWNEMRWVEKSSSFERMANGKFFLENVHSANGRHCHTLLFPRKELHIEWDRFSNWKRKKKNEKGNEMNDLRIWGNEKLWTYEYTKSKHSLFSIYRKQINDVELEWWESHILIFVRKAITRKSREARNSFLGTPSTLVWHTLMAWHTFSSQEHNAVEFIINLGLVSIRSTICTIPDPSWRMPTLRCRQTLFPRFEMNSQNDAQRKTNNRRCK